MRLCMGCMSKLEDEIIVCPHCGYRKDTPVEEPYYLVPGDILKTRYVVGKVLGYGGFGVTYIGWDTLLNRIIAVKEYFPSDYATRGLGNRKLTVYSGDAYDQFQFGLSSFISEAQSLAQLQNVEGVVQVYDCIQENGTGYIIMEYLEGETVKEALAKKGQYSYEEAERIIFCVLDTLAVVHKEGIIHRDIAPDNIFITKEGGVKLLDFGAARYAASLRSRSLSVILKPGYSPEEQYRSHGKQGPWTDVYGAGATFYRMITGRVPEEAIERMVEDQLAAPSMLGVTLSPWQESALMKSLSIKQEDRFQSAEEFRKALHMDMVKESAEATAGSRNHKSGERKAKKAKGKRIIAGGVVALLAGIFILQFYEKNERESRLVSTKSGDVQKYLKDQTDNKLAEVTKRKEPSIELKSEREPQEFIETEVFEKFSAEGISETETESEENPETAGELMSESKAGEEPKKPVEAVTESESEIETESEENPETAGELMSESKAGEEPEKPVEAVTESESEIETESETEENSTTESEMIPESETESEKQTEIVTESESEGRSEAEEQQERATEEISESETEKTIPDIERINNRIIYLEIEGEEQEFQIEADQSMAFDKVTIKMSGEEEDVVWESKTSTLLSTEKLSVTVESGELYDVEISDSSVSGWKVACRGLPLEKVAVLTLDKPQEYAFHIYKEQEIEKKEYQIKMLEEAEQRYALSNLNVRKLPDTQNGEVVSMYSMGDEINVYGYAKGFISSESSDWYLVKLDDGYGYISAREVYSTANKSEAEEAARAAEEAARAAQAPQTTQPQNSGGGGTGAPSGGEAQQPPDVIWEDGVVWD